MPYATAIGEMYTETIIPNTKVTSIHYQTLSKKDTKIDVNNLSVRSLQGLLLLFVDKRDDFANKNEEFYNPSIKKISITMATHFNFLGAGYGLGIFTQSLKSIFTKKALM